MLSLGGGRCKVVKYCSNDCTYSLHLTPRHCLLLTYDTRSSFALAQLMHRPKSGLKRHKPLCGKEPHPLTSHARAHASQIELMQQTSQTASDGSSPMSSPSAHQISEQFAVLGLGRGSDGSGSHWADYPDHERDLGY